MQYAVRLKETKEVVFFLDTNTGNYIFSDALEVVKDENNIECYTDKKNNALKVKELE